MKSPAFLLGVIVLIISVGIVHTQPLGPQFQAFVNRVTTASYPERTAIVDSFLATVPSFPFIEDTIAQFIYRGNPFSVSVPGDANGWDPAGNSMTRLSTTDLWYYRHPYESDARLDYKFVTDGTNWILDSRNPRQVSGGFGPNSELAMPGYVSPPEILFYSGIPHGTTMDTTFYSVNLGNSRAIKIYLPPSYTTSPGDSFNVILFHDGIDYVNLAQAKNTLDYLIAHGTIVPVIGIFVPPVNRTAEYAGGQMNQFSSFIVNELMPYVDARFRTRRMPSARATFGASDGGNIALWLGLHYPNVFGNVVAQSSDVISSISSGFQSSPRLDLKLYLDLGTYDISVLIPLVRNFIPILQSKGYTYLYKEWHEGHSWGNWRAHFDDALGFLFPVTPEGVKEGKEYPRTFMLEQNYPNPFNPSTTFSFVINQPSFVKLKILDMMGREVATVVNEFLSPGSYTRKWDGSGCSSGMYIYRLNAGRYTQTKKMLLVR